MFYQSAMFIDDHWFLLAPEWLRASPGLVFINTEQPKTDRPKLTRTTFLFEPGVSTLETFFEKGGQKISSEEDLLAPFYQDPSQRILVILVSGHPRTSLFVVKIEALLGLAREWGGADLEWGQWGTNMIEVPFEAGLEIHPWVSGCRLFFRCWFYLGDSAWMDVHDFSPRASARYMEIVCDGNGKFLRNMRPSVRKHVLPWVFFHFSGGGHDSITHLVVKASLPP